MVEKLEWLLDHWDQIGGILAALLALLAGKKWLTSSRVNQILVGANEGYEGSFIRKRVKSRIEGEVPSVVGLIRNLAAEADPDMDKKASVGESLKALAPDIARRAAGTLISRLFKRR